MDRRRFVRNLAAGAAGLSLPVAPWKISTASDTVTITVLHTNDMHSHIEPFVSEDERYSGRGGLARISALVKQIREENPDTLLFDAGDMFQGTPYFNYFGGELMFSLMSEIGYDAGTIGNHEFDNGLEGILSPLPQAKFPLVSSNYDFSDTILAGKFPGWKIFRNKGIKTGIYGLGIELKGLVADKNFGETQYRDPLKIALEMENFLRNDQKCDLVVCLSHLGHRYGENKISDLIIGGHTHTYLEKPVSVRNKQGREVIVNQAWWGGLVLGRIDFVFDSTGKKKKAITGLSLNG